MSTPIAPIAFAGCKLDRADQVRMDPDQLAQHMNWKARLLVLDGLNPAVEPDGTLQWTSLADADPDAELCFLGLMDGKAHFGAVPDLGATGPAYANPQAWAVMNAMQPEDLALYGGARSLLDWHARHRFCARCGGATQITKGGWQRHCDACGADHFPRTDPVTIMLVEDDDGRLLLGRQPRFPAKRFSALAGFVEPGETIEEAVSREILEEAGITTTDVRYVASQPWPFPSQLMIGCYARATSTDITIDPTELDEAAWFTRAEVEQAMDAGEAGEAFIAPPPFAVAYVLMKWWLDKGA